MTDINVPTLGESVTEATVGQWMKSPGDAVAKDEVLVELETDKVSVEVPAPEAGTLSEIVANEGETVEIGAVLARIGAGGTAAASAPASNGSAAATPAPAAPAASSGTVDVSVPDMGESVAEGSMGNLMKAAGEAVAKNEVIAEIETDKVALEVFAPEDGTIAEWLVAEGDAVIPGAVIARISAGAGASAPSTAPAPTPAAKAAATSAPAASGAGTERPVSPAVRRVTAEAGVDPAGIPGSGKGGRVTKGDALSFLERSAAQPAAAPVSAKANRELGPREERVKMTRLRQTIARRLKEAQNSAAMLTTFNDVDMGAIVDLRKQYKEAFEKRHGVRLGFMGFFVKACVNALQEIPAVNAEIDGTDIIYKNFYDIGVAAGTPKGLVVPVVRNCDELSLAGVEGEIARLGGLARDGDLAIGDMQGGTFTISNGGVYGSLMSTPILNPPQSGVLGMHRIEQRPVAIDGEVKIRPMMYLALSYDHRIVDGKEAVTFLVRVKENLEDPERLLLGV
ncbi:MAG: 2-oxoglutarate dehydrogenase complex dihydrolipoyllysine-residue succinyltransferase [Pseudomonadota bacterium]